MNEDELNRERIHMGMVFQYSALFDSMSVRENVAFGLRQHGHFSEEEIDSIVREKLHLVGLLSLIHIFRLHLFPFHSGFLWNGRYIGRYH